MPVDRICTLCQQQRELRLSHFLPKGLYRLLMNVNRTKNQTPVRLASGDRRQTSRQAADYLLCAECERRFDRNGENWVMRHLYRGRRVFRLRTMLRKSVSLGSYNGGTVYSASSLPVGAIDQLVYFHASLVWRASVRDWWTVGKKYQAIDLGPHREQLRRYLGGETGFPEHAVVTVILSQLEQPAIAFNFPESARLDRCRTKWAEQEKILQQAIADAGKSLGIRSE
jgi:hypothetical protein